VSEAQYISLILGFVATIATVLIALLLNNSRLTDVKEALRGETRGEVGTLRGELAGIRGEMATTREVILSQMATYQLDIISKIAELDNRITRLEMKR
jgi:hypothetical protein